MKEHSWRHDMRQPPPQTTAPLDPDPKWSDGYIDALNPPSSIHLPSSGSGVYSQSAPAVKSFQGTFHAPFHGTPHASSTRGRWASSARWTRSDGNRSACHSVAAPGDRILRNQGHPREARRDEARVRPSDRRLHRDRQELGIGKEEPERHGAEASARRLERPFGAAFLLGSGRSDSFDFFTILNLLDGCGSKVVKERIVHFRK